jgi:hypothetical protein
MMPLFLIVKKSFYKLLDRFKGEGMSSSRRLGSFLAIVQLTAFVRKRLSPTGYLGLHLTAGLALSVLFVWIFGGITEDVLTGDPLVALDRLVLDQAIYLRTPFVTDFMMVVTGLGGSKMILGGSLIVAICLCFKRGLTI